MKIDYELVDKIGATHYADGRLYKIKDEVILLIWIPSEEMWVESSLHSGWALINIKPIPPKPPVRVGYEKVTGSIFDLKDEFERGELYNNNSMIRNTTALADYYAKNEVYRRIEKPVDWRDEVSKFVNNADKGCGVSDVYVDGNGGSLTDDAFLEMCRVALRANGEL